MEATVKVEGMSCGHCQKAVEGALNELSGVSSVLVHLDKGEVDVSYDDAKVSLENIHEAIENQGYDVK